MYSTYTDSTHIVQLVNDTNNFSLHFCVYFKYLNVITDHDKSNTHTHTITH